MGRHSTWEIKTNYSCKIFDDLQIENANEKNTWSDFSEEITQKIDQTEIKT